MLQSRSYDFTMKQVDVRYFDNYGCFFNITNLFIKGRVKSTEIKEIEKTTALDMFGLVGGYLGLFVGVSLTTIIEFAEFGIDWIFKRYVENAQMKKKANERRVAPTVQPMD